MNVLTKQHLEELLKEPESMTNIERAMLEAVIKNSSKLSNLDLLNAYAKNQKTS